MSALPSKPERPSEDPLKAVLFQLPAVSETASNVFVHGRHCTLPRRHILKSPAAFSRIFRQAAALKGRCVDMRYLVLHTATARPVQVIPAEENTASLTPELIPLKVLAGFTVARRNGNAPYRNRCKRLMREAYRRQRQAISGLCLRPAVSHAEVSGKAELKHELHLVFSARRGQHSYAAVAADILHHFKHLRSMAVSA